MPHIHDLIDFTVEVFIVNDGKVLLRKHDKYDKWLSVGGHIELDEDPNQAALREVKEEVGLDVELIGESLPGSDGKIYTSLIPPVFLNRNRINGTHEHITFVYFTTMKDPAQVIVCPEEYRWLTVQEINDGVIELLPDIKYYAQTALK